ncbi:MAG: sigma-70 family RNA polymerase sigma factor [Deltaproteobacteria bacterium]|nr:sigma-70 family RNA polymerase sigma factor [Deltaproteobacteria bacterium]
MALATATGTLGSVPLQSSKTAEAPQVRLRALFEAHYDFVWRSLRRLGLDADQADDGAQEVFMVVSRRIGDVGPGAEKSFLYGTAMRVASEARRARSRRPEDMVEVAIDRAVDPALDPEALAGRSQARAQLDAVLDSLDTDLRAVFTLFELEGMTMAEISECLALPPGTVASRLRRAREAFQASVSRLHARRRSP